MKATQKTILLIVLAIVDCMIGGIIINSAITEHKKVDNATIKTSGNVLLLDDIFDTEIITTDKEEIKEEKVEPKEEIVYDGMTLKELGAKLDRSLNSTIKGKGTLIASYSLEKGVDPYVATAIILHETGCEWGCSTLVVKCNNVGGQKGSGCGSYAYFSSLDTGIKKFIDNLAKNYYAKGLNTPKKMNAKYAASKSWSKKVNNYVRKIKSK